MIGDQCQHCGSSLDEAARRAGRCPACGQDLRSAPPRPGWIVGERDLRRVAHRQRVLLWLIAAVILLTLATLYVGGAIVTSQVVGAFRVATLAAELVALIVIVQLMAALRYSMASRVLWTILMFAPCINILVLLAINDRATRAIQKTGLKVGLFGVSDDTLVKFLGANRCRACGYSLIGNRTGTCPECGATPDAAAPGA